MSEDVKKNDTETVDGSLSLVNRPASKTTGLLDVKVLRGKELGLSILRLGLAELEANRIRRLVTVVDYLEGEIFNLEKLKRLSDDEKVERYNLAIASIGTSNGYVNSALGSIDWTSLQTDLIELQESMNASDDEQANIADALNNGELNRKAATLLSELGHQLLRK